MLIRWRWDFLWGFSQTRYSMKYRHCDGKLVLKVTDNREVRESMLFNFFAFLFFLLFLVMWDCVWNRRVRCFEFSTALDDGLLWKRRICVNVEICALLMWCYCFWIWGSGMHVGARYTGSDCRRNLCPFDVLTSVVGESCIETVLMCFQVGMWFNFSNYNLNWPRSFICKSAPRVLCSCPGGCHVKLSAALRTISQSLVAAVMR